MKALFLDRDGVINRRLPGAYVRTPDEFELLTDIVPIITLAQQHSYPCILISNQQGVGKGLMTMAQLDAVTAYMQAQLKKHRCAPLDAVYYCTDVASVQSPRRKPSPGMLLEAIVAFSLDPAQCWFIGDSLSDAQAGQGAKVHTALVGEFPSTAADLVVPTLRELYVLLEKHLRQ